MTVAEKLLNFYYQLELSSELLPESTEVMNPYRNPDPALRQVLEDFHRKYFSDHKSRNMILGINPGRFGAGQTGIPFTDTPALRDHCAIETSIETKETSSAFVYALIDAYGGPQAFYREWFIGGVCPLGFLSKNKRGNWVNWNYYDDPELERVVSPFIVEKLWEQIDICGNPRSCILFGSGKNLKFLQILNQKEQFFDHIIGLEHPRFVMQYRRKQMKDYLEKFIAALGQVH